MWWLPSCCGIENKVDKDSSLFRRKERGRLVKRVWVDVYRDETVMSVGRRARG